MISSTEAVSSLVYQLLCWWKGWVKPVTFFLSPSLSSHKSQAQEVVTQHSCTGDHVTRWGRWQLVQDG